MNTTVLLGNYFENIGFIRLMPNSDLSCRKKDPCTFSIHDFNRIDLNFNGRFFRISLNDTVIKATVHHNFDGSGKMVWYHEFDLINPDCFDDLTQLILDKGYNSNLIIPDKNYRDEPWTIK